MDIPLGDGTFVRKVEPAQLGTASDWVQVVAGEDHTCGIRGGSTGDLWCWGNGYSGQVGDGDAWRVSPDPVVWP